MTRTRPITFLAGTAAVALAALGTAGCGGGGYGASAANKPAKTERGGSHYPPTSVGCYTARHSSQPFQRFHV